MTMVSLTTVESLLASGVISGSELRRCFEWPNRTRAFSLACFLVRFEKGIHGPGSSTAVHGRELDDQGKSMIMGKAVHTFLLPRL